MLNNEVLAEIALSVLRPIQQRFDRSSDYDLLLRRSIGTAPAVVLHSGATMLTWDQADEICQALNSAGLVNLYNTPVAPTPEAPDHLSIVLNYSRPEVRSALQGVQDDRDRAAIG